jgi:hypothetical protein
MEPRGVVAGEYDLARGGTVGGRFVGGKVVAKEGFGAPGDGGAGASAGEGIDRDADEVCGCWVPGGADGLAKMGEDIVEDGSRAGDAADVGHG